MTLVESVIMRAPPILKVVLVVVMLLPKVAAPEVENPPGAVMAPPVLRVKTPVLVTAIAPEPVAAKVLLTV